MQSFFCPAIVLPLPPAPSLARRQIFWATLFAPWLDLAVQKPFFSHHNALGSRIDFFPLICSVTTGRPPSGCARFVAFSEGSRDPLAPPRPLQAIRFLLSSSPHCGRRLYSFIPFFS